MHQRREVAWQSAPDAWCDDDRSPKNRLLAAMPSAEYARWKPLLEMVDLTLGQVLVEPGVELEYAYFPATAIISLLYVMQDGESAEIALVGNDGVLGVTLFMGGNSTTVRAVVQSAGWGYRLPAGALEAEVARGGATLRLLLLYTQSLVTQMTQTAACNKHHSLAQQFCRWLLLSFDRLQGAEMVMTQKLIAKMLGVKEDAVTATAAVLQATGAIAYREGRITLLNREMLEHSSCECYAAVKRECDRLLPQSAHETSRIVDGEATAPVCSPSREPRARCREAGRRPVALRFQRMFSGDRVSRTKISPTSEWRGRGELAASSSLRSDKAVDGRRCSRRSRLLAGFPPRNVRFNLPTICVDSRYVIDVTLRSCARVRCLVVVRLVASGASAPRESRLRRSRSASPPRGSGSRQLPRPFVRFQTLYLSEFVMSSPFEWAQAIHRLRRMSARSSKHREHSYG